MHPLVAHRDAVGDRDRAELERVAAGRVHAVLDRLGQPLQREVAGGDLVPARRDADLRLGEVVVAHADRPQHAARGGPLQPVGDVARARLDVGVLGHGDEGSRARSPSTLSQVTVDWADYAAVLFDLDGVVTPTAEVHMRAWSEMFNAYLEDRDAGAGQAAYTDADYFAHVDGKPRYDGVRDFLASRGIPAPEDARRRARRPQERRVQRRARARRGRGLPRLGGPARPPARPRQAAGGGLVVGQRPGGARGGGTGRPVRDGRERRRGHGARAARQARARTPSPTPPRCSARPPRRRSCSRTRCPASGPAGPATSRWSSASTAAPGSRP